MNIDELDEAGARSAAWCFGPEGNLPIGDVMLAQKIALENDEQIALAVANADSSTRGRRASHDARAIQGARFRGAELPYVQVASADKTRLCRNHVGWLGIAVVASLAGPARSDGTKRVKPVRPGLPNPLRLAAPDASGRQPCGTRALMRLVPHHAGRAKIAC